MLMKYREYEVLKSLKKYIGKRNKHSSKDYKAQILYDDFYLKSRYKRSSLYTIFKNLEEYGYIVDIANSIETTIHTVKITYKGQDALYNYRKECIKAILLRIFWMILGSLITIMLQIIF